MSKQLFQNYLEWVNQIKHNKTYFYNVLMLTEHADNTLFFAVLSSLELFVSVT